MTARFVLENGRKGRDVARRCRSEIDVAEIKREERDGRWERTKSGREARTRWKRETKKRAKSGTTHTYTCAYVSGHDSARPASSGREPRTLNITAHYADSGTPCASSSPSLLLLFELVSPPTFWTRFSPRGVSLPRARHFARCLCQHSTTVSRRRLRFFRRSRRQDVSRRIVRTISGIPRMLIPSSFFPPRLSVRFVRCFAREEQTPRSKGDARRNRFAEQRWNFCYAPLVSLATLPTTLCRVAFKRNFVPPFFSPFKLVEWTSK